MGLIKFVYAENNDDNQKDIAVVITTPSLLSALKSDRLLVISSVQVTLFSARAFITLPNAKRDLLILAPSLNRDPMFFVTVALSDPARSTKHSLATLTSVEMLAVLSFCLTKTCLQEKAFKP